jgi:hypothetical protein
VVFVLCNRDLIVIKPIITTVNSHPLIEEAVPQLATLLTPDNRFTTPRLICVGFGESAGDLWHGTLTRSFCLTKWYLNDLKNPLIDIRGLLSQRERILFHDLDYGATNGANASTIAPENVWRKNYVRSLIASTQDVKTPNEKKNVPRIPYSLDPGFMHEYAFPRGGAAREGINT